MSHPTRSILLVEDNPMDVDLARRAFARRAALNSIQVARDGEEVISCLRRWEAGETTPVVILLDLKLPRISGLEVLQRLKSSDACRMIPVIILTSSNEDKDIQTAYRLGANSYIVKPVDFHKFLDVAVNIHLYWTVLNTPP